VPTKDTVCIEYLQAGCQTDFVCGGVSSRVCIRPLYVVVTFRCVRTRGKSFPVDRHVTSATHFQPGWCLRVLFEDQLGVFQQTAVGISTGLRHQWGADCQVTFAFRESSVPAARAGAISGSRSAESKTPSQWNDGSVEAGLRRRLPLLANCLMPL
jgi:hypothetical protein